MTKISVILPVYNGEKYLAQSIESVLTQTHTDLELIIVNDCSTDSSLAIAQTYQQQDKRIKVISNESNQKLPASLNIGFAAATGDYWTWTSHDNYYLPHALETLLLPLIQSPRFHFSYAQTEVIDENGHFIYVYKQERTSPFSMIHPFRIGAIGACFLFSRTLAQKTGDYNTHWRLVEDHDIWIRMFLQEPRGFMYIPQILYKYRSHKKSLTAQNLHKISSIDNQLKAHYRPIFWKRFPLNMLAETLLIYAQGIIRKILSCTKTILKNIPFVKSSYKKIKRMHAAFHIKKQSLIPAVKQAYNWIVTYSIPDKGIAITSALTQTSYPEVSGYYIPTLLQWGDRIRAQMFADYLLSIQNDDGSWNDAHFTSPYTFDTGMILKGLLAMIKNDIDPEQKYRHAFLKGADWILTQQRHNGSISTPDTSQWHLPYNKKVPEAIHIYCLAPLLEAASLFNRPQYKQCVDRALNFYLSQHDLTDFSTLSHFHAYIIEGLIDVGKIQEAQNAMDKVAQHQKANGEIPAYAHVDFTCSTGMFQYAICWYKLGDTNRADKTFLYATSLQNKSGGWYGSYGKKGNYFPKEEISWTVKYFFDALYYKNKTFYEKSASMFLEHVSFNDARYVTLKNTITQNNAYKILDLGCGKGRFSKNLLEEMPHLDIHGVDISAKVMESTPPHMTTNVGSILNIPYPDNTFDVVFMQESLEHAILIEHAITEAVRVTKTHGCILVIDKNISELGVMPITTSEQWFDTQELCNIFKKNNCSVTTYENTKYDNYQDIGIHNLFTTWIAIKKL